MSVRMQGNIAIFVGYMLLLAASVNGWLAVLLVTLVVAVVSVIGLRQTRH